MGDNPQQTIGMLGQISADKQQRAEPTVQMYIQDQIDDALERAAKLTAKRKSLSPEDLAMAKSAYESKHDLGGYF